MILMVIKRKEFVMSEEKRVNPIMKFFKYDHLPEHLQIVSKDICEIAVKMEAELPTNAETSTGLRKLLEAKKQVMKNRFDMIENLTAEFLNNLNPKLKSFKKEDVDKRNITRVIQGNKTWYTTNGSRASKILDLSVKFIGV